jgi:transcriptional regulator GlxA family with amidase domain
MIADVDLALGLVEKDIGAVGARDLARMLVVHHRRAGGQSQHSALLELDAKSDRVQDPLTFARRNLREPLSVERLADAAHLSLRQFSRVFRAETGQSPAQAIENLRLEAARLMLEQGRQPVEAVARRQALATESACVVPFSAPMDKRPKRFEMPRLRSLRSDRSSRSIRVWDHWPPSDRLAGPAQPLMRGDRRSAKPMFR